MKGLALDAFGDLSEEWDVLLGLLYLMVLLLLYLINGHKFIHFTQSFIKIRLLLPKLRCPQDRDRNEANDGIPPSVACLAHGSAESATCELHARKEPSLSPNPT